MCINYYFGKYFLAVTLICVDEFVSILSNFFYATIGSEIEACHRPGGTGENLGKNCEKKNLGVTKMVDEERVTSV